MKFSYSTLLFLLAIPLLSFGQKGEKGFLKKIEQYKIKPVIGLQLWSSYTLGQEVFDEASGKYEKVDDRLNFQLRRSRFGIKGQPYENLKFNVTSAFDLVGRDILSGTEAGANNGGSPELRLWNAYVQWRVFPKSEHLHLTGGYFPVQIGRESITAAFRSTSMEKSWSQNYLRRHIVGIGPGRAMGANFGGMFFGKNEQLHFGYDLGIFSPTFQAYGGNSPGRKSSPLFTGRLAAYFGDPESKSYTLGHKINYFGKRNGLTLALAGTKQGATDLFNVNETYGFDFLFNWGNFNFDGEWNRLRREGSNGVQGFAVSSHTGYVRAGYNLYLKNGYVIEPVAQWVWFRGETQEAKQSQAVVAGSLSGEEQIIDFGFNLYFNPNLKYSLFYTLRDGDPGEFGDGATVNNYFFQSGVGAIRRGDWLGMGLVAIF